MPGSGPDRAPARAAAPRRRGSLLVAGLCLASLTLVVALGRLARSRPPVEPSSTHLAPEVPEARRLSSLPPQPAPTVAPLRPVDTRIVLPPFEPPAPRAQDAAAARGPSGPPEASLAPETEDYFARRRLLARHAIALLSRDGTTRLRGRSQPRPLPPEVLDTLRRPAPLPPRSLSLVADNHVVANPQLLRAHLAALLPGPAAAP